MSDFDFDELDRAVNNAFTADAPSQDDGLVETLDTTTSSNESTNQQPAATPATSSAHTPAASRSVPQKPQPQPQTQPVTTPAPAVRRSSGRFMDVVHPSSDMRSGFGGAPSTNTPVAARPQPAVSSPVAPAATLDELSQEDWQKPLESPFLSDAKVEKRPLGGEAPTSTEFDPLHLLEEPDDPRIEAETMPDPIDFAAQAQVSQAQDGTEPVKTSQPVPEAEAVTAEAPAAHSEVPVQAIDTSKQADTDDTAFGYGEGSFQPEATQESPAGPTSINQQYKEQPSSSPQSGAIYDTEAYHQPLAPVAKKKKPSFAILWILLILILGAGAGAAFYFYVLPLI